MNRGEKNAARFALLSVFFGSLLVGYMGLKQIPGFATTLVATVLCNYSEGEDETHLVDCGLLRVARIFLPIY